MPQPRILVLRAPGTNCDAETRLAFEKAGGQAEVLHLNRWLEKPALIRDVQLLCIPGGFSYGDDVAAGRIFAVQLRRHLAEELQKFRDDDRLVLGICNGFQVLLKTGLLQADDQNGPAATLAWNESGRFIDRWVRLRSTGGPCVFLSGIESLELPIAHAEGNFRVRDQAAFDQLDQRGQLPLRYQPSESDNDRYNPNGSMGDVAGMCDATGRLFGLMPHPERFVEPTHHPTWTRLPPIEEPDGMRIFRNAVRYFS